MPVVKPRPPQPPTKPRAATTNTATPTVTPPVTPTPVPRPRPRRRTQDTIRSHDKPSSTINEDTTPPIKEETTPVLIAEEITSPVEETEEEVPVPVVAFSPIPEETTPPCTTDEGTPPCTTDEATPPIDSSREPSVIIEESSESKEECLDTATDDVMEITKDDPKTSDDVMEVAKDDTVANDDTNSNDDTKTNIDMKDAEQAPVEIKDQEMEEQDNDDVEESVIVPSEVDKIIPEAEEIAAEDKELQDEPVAEGEEAGNEEKESSDNSESLYEDMDMGAGPPPEVKDESDESEYEMVDFEPPETSSGKTVGIGQSLVPEPLETSSQGESTSSYVMMDPSDTTSDEYIEIIPDNVFKEKVDSIEYDKPSEWGSTINESPRSTKMGEYDVPRPASSQSDRGSPIMSSGSTGSRGHGSPGLPRIGSKGQSDRVGALRAEGGDRNLEGDRLLSGGSQGVSGGMHCRERENG